MEFIDSKFLVSISNEIVENKDTDIWKRLTYSVREINLSTLCNLLNEHYAFCGVFKSRINLTQTLKKGNWEQTNLVVIDLDDRKKTFSEFCNIIFDSDIVPNVVYKTQNDGIKGNRYRAIYCFDTPIINEELYKRIYNIIISKIDSLTDEVNKDNCGGVIAQSFAGAKEIIKDDNINNIYYSLYDFIKENNLFDVPNIKKCNSNYNKDFLDETDINIKNYQTNSVCDLNKFKDIKTEKKCNSKTNIKENNIIVRNALLENSTDNFITDYFKLRNKQLIEKYYNCFEIRECAQLPKTNEDIAFIELPQDYIEIKRYWFVEHDEEKDTNISRIIKVKDGEQRRKKLFLNAIRRRLINQSISFDNLLFCVIWEFSNYYINNGNKITKKEIFELTQRAYKEDLSRYEQLKGNDKRKWIINSEYCIKNNISKKKALNTARTQYNDYKIGELYDCSLTDKQNLEVINNFGIDIKLRTLQNFKKRNNLQKNKKNKLK